MKAFWFSLVVLLLVSVSAVFAQSEVSVTSSVQEKEGVKPKIQKVSEIRKVVKIADVKLKSELEAQKQVRYDEKGGIIVPNASEGIQQKSLTAEQKRILQKIQQAKSKQSLNKNVPQQQPIRKVGKSAEKRVN